MAKFEFKYSSVKQVKETFEKKAQRELAQIDLIIKEHKERKKLLIEEVNAIRNKNYKKNMTASEIKFLLSHKNSLEKEIELENSELEKLDGQKQIKLEEVVSKTKERKILSKLEELYKSEFVSEINKTELKAFDEIAVQKFAKVTR